MNQSTIHKFPGFLFKDTLPEAGYELPIKILPYNPEDKLVTMLVGLVEGWSFEPRAHPFPCKVTVVTGHGFFSINGDEHFYANGVQFIIPANMKHAFTQIQTNTVFEKEVPNFLHLQP